MKKRIVTLLLVSALAATVFAGCGKSGGDAADAAATGEAAVAEEAVEEGAEAAATGEAAAAETADEDLAAAVEAADTAEVAAEAADEAATESAEIAAEEFVDEEEEAAPAEETAEAVDEAAAEETEDLIVDPGTQYTVRFGGNVYATPDQNDANIIDYVYPGYVLQIDERLDDFWYNVSYWINGAMRTGYIKIQ